MVSFFLYISVIITIDGQVKTHTVVADSCPSTEYVMQSHQAMIDAGEITDWRASCVPYEFDMPLPAEKVGV